MVKAFQSSELWKAFLFDHRLTQIWNGEVILTGMILVLMMQDPIWEYF